MATTLEVVNECLATMGEAPLNTLSEPHEYKSSALRYLARANKAIQSRGWWFNTEYAELAPNSVNGQIQLPGDCLKFQSGVRTQNTFTAIKPWLVQRGTRIYDTTTGSYVLSETVSGEIVREVAFDELPHVMNDYIASEAVLKFQSNFDADNSKRQELDQANKMARALASAENIRQYRVNLLNNNSRLARIKRVTRRSV